MDENDTYADNSSRNDCGGVFTCVIVSCLVILSSVLAIAGNSFNIVVLTTGKFLTKPHLYFLISLAVADLLTGIINTFSIYPSIANVWPYGKAFCLLTNYFRESFLEVSLLMILCLNFERFIAVSYPFRSKSWVTRKRAKVVIFLCWVVTFVIKIYLVFDFVYVVDYDEEIYACTPEYDSYQAFAIFTSIVIEVPALVILTITSIHLMVKLKKLNSRTRRDMFHEPSGRSRNSVRSRDLKKNLHGFKVLVVIAIVSYITLLPSLTLRLIYIDQEEEGAPRSISPAMEFSFFWLASCGSYANVFVYSFMDRNFSKYLRGMCQKLKRPIKRRPPASSRGGSSEEDGLPTNNPLSVISGNHVEKSSFYKHLEVEL